jgi:hypothetical protein
MLVIVVSSSFSVLAIWDVLYEIVMYVVLGLCAVRAGCAFISMWLSAIALFVSCRCWKPRRVGEVLPNFRSDALYGLLLQEISPSSLLRFCLHHDASPLHWLTTAPLAWLHRHPRYKEPLLPDQGRRSCNPVRCLPSERDTVRGMQIFAYR